MAKLTITERLIRGLQAREFVELKPTTHYRVFRGIGSHTGRFYYVGNAGALRFNRTGKVSQTFQAPNLRAILLKETETNG